MTQQYDVVVMGAGPAGYVAAIRAAQNGLSVACIDKWKNYDGSEAFGGTCLNAGCIPSKALLESSELYHRATHEFDAHGIVAKGVKFDLATMQSRKTSIVKQFTGGIQALFKANKVDGLFGTAKLTAANQVTVTKHDGTTEVLTAKHVIIATGSEPIELPFAKFDEVNIIDSWRALELDQVPKRLGVIGGGVIGLELGSVWKRLGAEVTVLEAMDDFLFMADQQLAKEAQRQFTKQGLDIKLGAKASQVEVQGKEVLVTYTQSGAEHTAVFDKLIVAVGRRPHTTNAVEASLNLAMTDRGFIQVNEHGQTSIPNVWAAGDVTPGPMLAHKGSEEGVAIADRIAGLYAEVDHNLIPSVIYTAPEIAWVGKTEEQLKADGVDYKAGQFSFAANGRARALDQAVGFAKVLASKDDDTILGVHIIGPFAGELIAEAVLAMSFNGCAEDLQRTVHAHPSLSEALHEAALGVDHKMIHAINR